MVSNSCARDPCGTPGRRTSCHEPDVVSVATTASVRVARAAGVPPGPGLRSDQATRRSPGLSGEAGVNRGEARTRLNVGTDPDNCRCMNNTGAIRCQHARTAMAAQNARGVSGLAVTRVVIRMTVPLDGVRVEVVVGRFGDGEPGDQRKLQQERRGGGLTDPECVARPQHVGKFSEGDGHPTRPSANSPWIIPRAHRERRGAALARRFERRIAELFVRRATKSEALGM